MALKAINVEDVFITFDDHNHALMQKRNNALDVIRGIAIILVLLHHILLISDHYINNSCIKYLKLLLTPFIIGGWVGVDLFFVLSGFFVSGLLFNEYKTTNTIRPVRFLIRRAFKIYPGFIFFILASLLVEVIQHVYFNEAQPYYNGYLKDLLFLHNYMGGHWVTTWSLDVEEAFYLFLTLLFIVAIRLNKLNKNTIISTYIILAITGIAGRILANIMYPRYDFLKQYTATHYRLDALFFGVVLAYFYHFKKQVLVSAVKKNRAVIIICCVFLLLPNFIFEREFNRWIAVILLTTNAFAFGLLIIIVSESNLHMQSNILAFTGRHSYAIYLWHPFANQYLIKFFNPATSQLSFVLYILCYLCASFILGLIATKIIEIPFLRLREKYFPAKNT